MLTVAHDEFKDIDFLDLKKEQAVVYDVKNRLSEVVKDGGL